MGYQTSDIGIGHNANLKVVYWDCETLEKLPINFDDKYRFIRLMTIRMFKTSVAGNTLFRVALQRENFPNYTLLWQRYWQSAEVTGVPSGLQAGEQVADAQLNMVPSFVIVGTGVIMPPRTRIETFLSTTSSFNIQMYIELVEAVRAEDLSQFI